MKIAIRSLWKNKLTSIVNLIGLALAFGTGIVLFLWLSEELGKNKFLAQHVNIFQVISHIERNDKLQSYRATSFPIIGKLSEYSAIKEIAYLSSVHDNALVLNNDQKFYPSGKHVNANFFRVFERKWLYGDVESALAGYSSIVISDDLAQKLFGDNWLSQVVEADITLGGKQVKIAGVFEEFPKSSTLKFDFCTLARPQDNADIGNLNYETYVLSVPGADLADVEKGINEFIRGNLRGKISFQNIADIYLYSAFSNGEPKGGRITYIKLFGWATFFLMFMAAINFTNLFAANALKKSKEIAIKKVVGAAKGALIKDLFLETLFIAGISLLMSVVAVLLFLPTINLELESQLNFSLFDPILCLQILSLCVVVAMVAGTYPALQMASLHPSQMLKVSMAFKVRDVKLTKVLLAMQLIASLFIFIFSFGVEEQIQLLETKDLGFEAKGLIIKRLSKSEISNIETVKKQLSQYSFIEGTTVSGSDFRQGLPMTSDVVWPSKQPKDSTKFGIEFVDRDFIKIMKIHPIIGGFTDETSLGTINVVLNARAASIMGGADRIIGQTINVWGSDVIVRGIIEDFQFNPSLLEGPPMVLVDMPLESEFLIVRAAKGYEQEAVNIIEHSHREYGGSNSFDYAWIEEAITASYKDGSKTKFIARTFFLIAAGITIMGFFALAYFNLKSKAREISIRKVLGAEYKDIIKTILVDFVGVISVSYVIAIPAAYYALDNWLANFPYRIDLDAFTFLAPAIMFLFIIVMIGLYHSVTAQVLNPVRNLGPD